MSDLTDLMGELKRSDLAREAMDILESALSRRTDEEKGAFWRAVDLYYFSRKAPPEATAPQAGATPPVIA